MEKIPILDLKKQIAPLRKELDTAIKEVIDEANFVFGRKIQEFEEGAAKYCKVKYAIGVSNGTDAIRLALLALGVKSKDKVICPAFTFYATASAIAGIGAVPVFADIDPLTYNISPECVEKILKRKVKARAIIPVHLYGQCADMQALLSLARRYGLKVIEDAAQAFGAEYKGKKAGAMGDCGAVSFFPGKNLGAFGDAGMVLTDNKALAQRLRLLRNQGNRERYFHTVIGYNHRMDTLQAAVLKVKLRYLDRWNQKRRKIAAYFNKNLSGLDIITPYVAPGNKHIYHQYVLRLKGGSAGLIAHLKQKGIDARVYYPLPLHLQKCFQYLGYKRGGLPESERAAQEVLAIPVYPDLARRQMDYIVTSIREFLR
jgi:dTDP-4-amino-4,6-dideoxygalactose transaminase